MQRDRTVLAASVVGLLVALSGIAFIVPVDGPLGVIIFIAVACLVAVLFFRFNPAGDAWELAQSYGISPWLAVGLVLMLVAVLFLLRLLLLQSA